MSNKKAEKKVNKKLANSQKKSYADFWFQLLGSNLADCGKVSVNKNDMYLMKKYIADINRCIKIIANKTGKQGLQLCDKDTREVIPRSELKKEYEYLESLFKEQTWEFWKKDFFTNMYLSGENYINPMYNERGKIIKFVAEDSRAVTKNIKDGVITSFNIYNGRGQKTSMVPRQDLGWSLYERDVTTRLDWMSILEGLIYDVLSEYESSKRNYYFFRNNSIPSAIVMLDEGLDGEQLKYAAENIKRKFEGGENAHKFIINNAVKDIKTLSLSPKDMEFLQQRGFTRDKIAAAFGVPKELLGYTDDSGAYERLKEIRKEFNQDTIYTVGKHLEDVINMTISQFADRLFIDLSKYSVKVKTESFEDTKELYEMYRKNIESGLQTVDEVRVEMGKDPYELENTNVPLMSRNITILSDLSNDQTPI